jgi:small-conductance mechanosensitive channel
MEGHVVQAPNSYLNTLFILNQRRSGGLAEAVTISIKFGTTLEQIETLRSKLLEFVKAEKREYQGNILTELRDIVDVHSMNLNVVFFYKSNWQNEGLRLARRNKFICALMVCIQELNIEGPYMRFPGHVPAKRPAHQQPRNGHWRTAEQPCWLRPERSSRRAFRQPGRRFWRAYFAHALWFHPSQRLQHA